MAMFTTARMLLQHCWDSRDLANLDAPRQSLAGVQDGVTLESHFSIGMLIPKEGKLGMVSE